jgi:hypothetical protein
LEFLFVVESTEDPAYHAVSRLLSMYQVQQTCFNISLCSCYLLSIDGSIVHMAFFCLEVSTDSTFFLICLQCTQDHVEAKVVVAGLSTTCSQKIHNQLVCMIFFFSQYFFYLSFVTVLKSTVITTMKS